MTTARTTRSPVAMSVELLGGFTLTVEGLAVDLPGGAQRVVALLALGGRTSRSRIAGTLWPDTTEDRALASLRTVIWRINRVAGGLVSTRGTTAELASTVDVDVHRLERAGLVELQNTCAAEARGGDVAGDHGSVDLLPGWDDEWLLADRERLHQLRLHVLEAQAARLSGAGRYGLALATALVALRADPLRESAHRTVIAIHLAEGNVVEARRATDICHRTLRLNGLAPSSAVLDLELAVAGYVFQPATLTCSP